MALKHAGISFPPPLVFVIPLGAGLLVHRYWSVPLLPESSRGLGVVLGWLFLGFGAFLFGWALTSFARARTPVIPNRPVTRLMTDGPYSLTRNPMYLSMASLYLGVTALKNSLWPLILFPGAILLMHALVIRKEEQYLEEAFGDEYRAFRARVRRWL